MAEEESEYVAPPKRIEEAKNTFALFDKKGEGKVPTKQFNDLFKALGLHLKPEQQDEYIEELDDGQDQFNVDMFVAVFVKKLRADDEEKELKEAFRVLDKNKQGEIPTDELRWILRELDPDLDDEDIDAMIDDIDADGSGMVDYDEFYALMMGG